MRVRPLEARWERRTAARDPARCGTSRSRKHSHADPGFRCRYTRATKSMCRSGPVARKERRAAARNPGSRWHSVTSSPPSLLDPDSAALLPGHEIKVPLTSRSPEGAPQRGAESGKAMAQHHVIAPSPTNPDERSESGTSMAPAPSQAFNAESRIPLRGVRATSTFLTRTDPWH